jgi:hypothetical protein
MASININNFSVTIVSFPEITGVDWTQDNPSVVLLLTPDTGYTITASNFSATTPLPTYVSSVVFSQNGANIDCVVNYISPSLMPANDVLIDICAAGYAEQTPVTLSGTIKDCGISNTLFPASGDLPSAYSGSGDFGTTATVLTQSVTASTGYYFEVEPILALSIGNINNYTITNSKTYNSSNQLTSIVFTVTYTFPAANATGDEFCLTANAKLIYDPLVRINSYSFNQTPVPIGGITRNFTINGITGANWALTCTGNPGGINIVNTSGTIDSTGQAIVNVIFPPQSVETTYTFVLTGDLAASFGTTSGQPSTFIVYQFTDTTLAFGFTSTDSAITVGAVDSKTFVPVQTQNIPQQYTVIATSTGSFVLANQPATGDWSNQGLVPAVSGQYPVPYNQAVQTQTLAIDNTLTPSKLTAVVNVNMQITGTQNLVSNLNLDNFVQGTLVPVTLTFGSTATNACCAGTSSGYFVASGQTFLTATSVLDASGNPAADGFYKQ